MKKALKTINHDEPPIDDATNDPKNLNGMLYDRCCELLRDEWDEMDTRQRIATLTAISNVQVRFIKIRADHHVPAVSGTTVRRYEKAFAANATRKRKSVAGDAAVAALLTNDGEPDELEY